MSRKDHNMKPGDLVRVRNLSPDARHHGKVGVVVALESESTFIDGAGGGPPWRYDVLLDGGIAHFYGVYLEPVDEAR
jgi:hypothetical protein